MNAEGAGDLELEKYYRGQMREKVLHSRDDGFPREKGRLVNGHRTFPGRDGERYGDARMRTERHTTKADTHGRMSSETVTKDTHRSPLPPYASIKKFIYITVPSTC